MEAPDRGHERSRSVRSAGACGGAYRRFVHVRAGIKEPNEASVPRKQQPREEPAVARHQPVANLHQPHQGPSRQRGSEARPPDPSEDVEASPSCPQRPAVGSQHVDGPSAVPGQGIGHRGARGVLVRYRVESIERVLPLDPSDRAAAEPSATVPKEPRLVGAMIGRPIGTQAHVPIFRLPEPPDYSANSPGAIRRNR
jgi:hypothetical protein